MHGKSMAKKHSKKCHQCNKINSIAFCSTRESKGILNLRTEGRLRWFPTHPTALGMGAGKLKDHLKKINSWQIFIKGERLQNSFESKG